MVESVRERAIHYADGLTSSEFPDHDMPGGMLTSLQDSTRYLEALL